MTVKIAKIESIPLRIPFTTGGPSDAGVWGKAFDRIGHNRYRGRRLGRNRPFADPPIVPKKGAMEVPQNPGLGLEPSADVVRKYRLA